MARYALLTCVMTYKSYINRDQTAPTVSGNLSNPFPILSWIMIRGGPTDSDKGIEPCVI